MRTVTHGTVNEYNNYGCRCDLCKAAVSEERKRTQFSPCPQCGARTQNRYRPSSLCRTCRALSLTISLEERHGTETGYSKGCRCAKCREAARTARLRRRHTNWEASRAYDREYNQRRRSLKSEEAP